MNPHPGKELQNILKELWYSQRAFAQKIWKSVSELNELLKGRRNFTIQRDILLTKVLGTLPKYWIQQQLEHDYDLALVAFEQNSHSAIQTQTNKSSKKKKLSQGDLKQKKDLFLDF